MDLYPPLYHREEFLFPKSTALFLPPSLPATTDFFTVSLVLPFPKCSIVGIPQNVAFPNWLLSLTNMHVRFPFARLIPHFLLALNIPLSEYTTASFLF